MNVNIKIYRYATLKTNNRNVAVVYYIELYFKYRRCLECRAKLTNSSNNKAGNIKIMLLYPNKVTVIMCWSIMETIGHVYIIVSTFVYASYAYREMNAIQINDFNRNLMIIIV